MKEKLIEEIKELIKIDSLDDFEINPNYLNYFEEDELINIKTKLEEKKSSFSSFSSDYIDQIYEKAKKDEI